MSGQKPSNGIENILRGQFIFVLLKKKKLHGLNSKKKIVSMRLFKHKHNKILFEFLKSHSGEVIE